MVYRQKIILLVALILGTLVQVLPVIRSGLKYDYGLGFWGPTGHDSIWHLSLINHIKNPLSIDMPVFSGEKLQNYHPFFDILISSLSHLLPISSTFLLFQVFPIISSFIFLYLSFLVGQNFTATFSGGIYLIFLNSFANSFGWLVSIFKSANFSGETIFWSMQSPSNQINPPYLLSLIFILLLILIIQNNSPKHQLRFLDAIHILLILVLLPITKVYGGLVGFIIIGFYSLASAINRHFRPLIVYLISIFLGYYLFSIYNHSSASLLVFQPFWFIDSMLNSTDRLFLPYLAQLLFSPYRPLVIFFGILIFYLGNYGWRLLAFTNLPKLSWLNVSLITVIIINSLVPLFFIQNGTSWNTIQFLYYGLFVSNIFFAHKLVYISHQRYGSLLITLIFITYFLAFVGTSPNYLGKIPPASLPTSEIQALNYLQSLPQGTILTYPYDPYLKKQFNSTPIPLYAYETTSYVSAFSHNKTFLEDEMNLNNSGYEVNLRLKSVVNFFNLKNNYTDRGFLVNNQIDYIYLVGTQISKFQPNLLALSIDPIYNHDGIIIYKVRR